MSGNHVIYTEQNMQYLKVQGHKCSSVFKNLVDIYKYKYTMLESFHCGTLLPSPPEGANCLQCRSTTCRRRLRKSWWCWDRDWMRHWSRRGEPCIADWLRRGGSSYLTWWAEVDIQRSLHLFIVTDVKNICFARYFRLKNEIFLFALSRWRSTNKDRRTCRTCARVWREG